MLWTGCWERLINNLKISNLIQEFQEFYLQNNDKYRYIEGADEKVVLSINSYSLETIKKNNMVTEQLNYINNTEYYYISSLHAQNSLGGNGCEIRIIPEYVWGMFESKNVGDTIASRISIDGKNEIEIKSDEAIVSKAVYDYLNKEYGEDKDIVSRCDVDNMTMVIRSDQPDKVVQILYELNLPIISNYELKQNAMIEKQIVVKNKYVIAIVLFILLGINLYSSFANALNEIK